MSLWEAILLGLLQGVTEYLPVSSSAHLEIAQRLLGRDLGSEGLLFSVTVHSATALSTLVVLRKPLLEWGSGILSNQRSASMGFGRTIALSLIPAAVVGLFFDDAVEGLFDQELGLMGAFLVLTGLMLYLAHRSAVGHGVIGTKEALVLGIAQAIAVFPGLSRPGMVLSSALIMGVERKKAAEFAFLMVVPVILSKFALDARNLWLSAEGGFEFQLSYQALLAAFASAFVAGLYTCQKVLKWIETGRFAGLALYCFALGIALAFWGLYQTV